MSRVLISTTAIVADPACQPRIAIDPRIVEDYTDDMTGGAEFPPLTVYHDGDTYWLADGFHRLTAALNLGLAEIACDVRDGDKRAAILHSCSANSTHGQRRTNQDKNRAVETMLNDEEWGSWSDREIARRCGVDHTFVGKIRCSLVSDTSERTYKDRYGNVHTMNTANIGKELHDKAMREAASTAKPWTPPATIPAELIDDFFPDAEDYEPLELAPAVDWDSADAAAFKALAGVIARDARRVAFAGFGSDPIQARIFANRIKDIGYWLESFTAAVREIG